MDIRAFTKRAFMGLVLASLLGAVVAVVSAETIDPNSDNSQFAYGENVGWINAEPLGNGNAAGTTVTGLKLTGYMYGENIGWINLNCTNNNTCATTGNYGVVNDGLGKLSGYAWGENVGWISFNCSNTPATCATTNNYGVTINRSTGDFSGYAYGENIGWISFNCTNQNTCGTAQYKVKTADDGDGIAGATDNCPFDANVNQANADADFINLHVFGKLFDDKTVLNSDDKGDVCDTDADNDGFLNTDELQLGPAGTSHALCPSASAATNPLKLDSDGDGVSDRAECLLGTDPMSAASKPPVTYPTNVDADHDGLPDTVEAILGTNATNADSDGDGLTDGLEVRAYGSNPLSANTDGDICNDAQEVASVDANTGISSSDLLAVAQAFGPSTSPGYIPDMDENKNGNINSTDLLFVASHFGAC